MPWFQRSFALLVFIGAGAGIGALFDLADLAIPGAGAGLLGWLLWDNWRILRFLSWLRLVYDDAATPMPRSSGIWREAAERVYRLLRQQIKHTRENEASLRNLQAALQASPNGVIVLDNRTRIEWCNRMACQHFGLDGERDIAQSVTHLVRDPAFVAYMTARRFDHEVILTSPINTAAHPLRLSVRIYPYGQGRLLMLSQDITLLEQVEATRRDFVANVSHEIRTPLTVLAGFIETLQTLPLTRDEREDYLERMAQQAGRMKNLVDDLLTLSRLENSPPPGMEQWTPVRLLLQQCEIDARALSAHLSGQTPHSLEFPPTDALSGEIAGAPGELHSALFNLINNAIRYTPPGGRIEVAWTPQAEGGALFSVCDNGPGIAPEYIPRLTERFYRVDNDHSRSSGGTGLGLSIVKHVLQRHGASLRIESTPGHGACFTAVFPQDRIRETPLS
ncbi:MAG: phosphate regulon sensor histidine kinase PhoR [Azoarcus sp.]|jgi:two-component system phosphate regulon sensor histidine kinase PhoR|nr:phosphate regulon sensor histidine kinase PhoR [Azoarcus sp.]